MRAGGPPILSAGMELEDHVGDVLQKARLHAGLAAESVAAAAGLNPGELTELERTGRLSRPLHWTALARRLGLDPAKLRALAEGWRPAPAELSRWRELRRFTTRQGGYPVNAYLVWDEVTREAAVFDTGFDPVPLLTEIERHALQLRHLFLTHSHPDHVAGVAALRARFPRLRLHTSAPDAPVDQRNRPQECVPLGSLRITHRETPGHSEDGVTYLVGNWPEDAPHVAFVGDALFAGSMGRVPGDAAAARDVVRRQILALPPETLICPGHGPLTTVGEERAHNPFF